MADTNYEFTNRKKPNWLNQYFATSGKVPSAGMIDDIIQGELNAASNKRYQSGILDLQSKHDEWSKNLAFMNANNAERDRKAKANQGMISGLVGLGTTALQMYGGKRNKTGTTSADTSKGIIGGTMDYLKNMYHGQNKSNLDFSGILDDSGNYDASWLDQGFPEYGNWDELLGDYTGMYE
jgi:hypothetical protein